MFELKEDNGNFAYSGSKKYRGFVDIEITAANYFDIDSKEYLFKTNKGIEFRLISRSNEPINKSAKLGIETSLFDKPDEAERAINSHFYSLRLMLYRSSLHYKGPLKCGLIELPHTYYSGKIGILLENERRLDIKEKSCFHNENGVWYKMYCIQDKLICESNKLCIESNEFASHDEAKQAIDAIRPLLEMFLTNNSFDAFKVIELDVNLRPRPLGYGSLGKRLLSFDGSALKESTEDEYLHKVFDLIEYKGLNDLPNLYNIYETIKKDMRPGSYEVIHSKLEELGLSNKIDLEKMHYSVNRPDVVGVLNARHGATREGNENPKKALSANKCRIILQGLIEKWIDYKTNLLYR